MTNNLDPLKPDPIEARTTNAALIELRARLAAYTEEPFLESLVLLAHVMEMTKAWVLAHPEAELSPENIDRIEDKLVQRENGMPLPYLVGKWDFYGLEFEVSPAVLIPRPETELLVETALEWLRTHPRRRRALDIGTGSGCIAITLAVNVRRLLVFCSDISLPALRVASENAVKHEIQERTCFFQADLAGCLSGRFDIICANLPYVPAETLRDLEVGRHEPVVALDGGPGGMDCIRRFLHDAPRLLAPGGLLLMEIEARQGPAASVLARDAFPHANIALLQDLAGHDRLVAVYNGE